MNVLESVGEFINQVSGASSAMKKQQEFNASEAEKQRQYEKEMANSAYQRAAKDMQEAGLNPGLMYGSGSAAATPSGASANSAASMGNTNLLNSIAAVVGAAGGVARTMNDKNEQKYKAELYEKNNKMMNSAVNLARILSKSKKIR